MVATESQDVLNRRFFADFALVSGFFNTLLVMCRAKKSRCLSGQMTPLTRRHTNADSATHH